MHFLIQQCKSMHCRFNGTHTLISCASVVLVIFCPVYLSLSSSPATEETLFFVPLHRWWCGMGWHWKRSPVRESGQLYKKYKKQAKLHHLNFWHLETFFLLPVDLCLPRESKKNSTTQISHQHHFVFLHRPLAERRNETQFEGQNNCSHSLLEVGIDLF